MRADHKNPTSPTGNYLTHQLNKSPTKTTYTFGQLDRFGNRNDPKIEKSSASNTPSMGVSRATITSSQREFQKRNVKSPKVQNRIPTQKKMSSEKIIMKTSPRRRWQEPTISSQNKSKSKEKPRSRDSRGSKQKQMREEETETVMSYQNLGESNATKKTYGSVKTTNSRGRNHQHKNQEQVNLAPEKRKTVAYTFSRSPRSKQQIKREDNDIGPGKYEKFSEFGTR